MIVAVLAMVCLGTSTYGQTSVAQKLSFDQGVSHELVYCLLKDRRGFLWIGTMYGLVRYDGRTFVSFRHHPEDSTSLSNDDILSLHEDRSGNLWVGTFAGGVNRYDPLTGVFSRFVLRDSAVSRRNIVWSIVQDSSGIVWLGTEQGVDRLDPETGARRLFGDSGWVDAGVRNLYVDRHQRLWIGTFDAGIRMLNLRTGRLTTYRHVPDDSSSLGSDRVTGFAEDREGGLWVSTLGGGLNRYDRGSFRSIVHTGAGQPIRSVGRIIDDPSGSVWLGTFGGVYRLNEDGSITLAASEAAVGKNIIALASDSSGLLWVGTYLDGITQLSFEEPRFRTVPMHDREHSTCVRSLFVLRGGDVMIGTDAGLHLWDPERGIVMRQQWYDRLTDDLPSRTVSAVLESDDGMIWVGTLHGLYRHDPGTGRTRRFVNDRGTGSLSATAVNCLLEDRGGNVWVGTASGLNRYHASTGRFERYGNAPDGRGLSSDYILSLFEDSGGRMWIGTYGCTDVMSADRKAFSHYPQDPYDPSTMTNNYALSFFEDSSGVWIGTAGGLNRIARDGSIRHWTAAEGLPNAVIAGIVPDARGRLWLSTHHGLVCFDPRSETMSSYDAADGLPGNMFTSGALGRLADGRPVFGAMDGVLIVQKPLAEDIIEMPQVCLTDFRLLSQELKPGRHTSAVPSVIRLDHDENSFVIGFTAPDFHSSGRNRFAYRLLGSDSAWIEVGNMREAVFTALAPGSYTFEARTTDGRGRWSERRASVDIFVEPPFWKTAWFGWAALLVAAGSLWWLHRLRVRSRVRRLLELETIRREERERVRRKAASDFHDELGHRLTKIGLFSEIVKRTLKPVHEEVKVYLDKIIDDAELLGHETRDFIWSLDPDQDSLYDFVEYLRDYGYELFDRTGVSFAVDTPLEQMVPWKLTMDRRRQITLIFKEAMNNALRHSGASRVTLSAHVVSDTLHLRLADDGRGFQLPDRIEGHGLSNMRKRAEAIGAALEVDTEPGKGVSVRLTAGMLEGSKGQPIERRHAH